MNRLLGVLFILVLIVNSVFTQSDFQKFEGYFPFEWDEEKGKIYLEVDKINHEFLYVNSLAAGIGSNDIGLDRGQLGNTRLVKFTRAGNKILLIQTNLKYRAVSQNSAEVKAVEEAFAQSIIWGFPIKEKTDKGFKIDLTPFLLRDAHGVIGRLKSNKQGTYKLDESRSALWMDRTKNFPQNSEFESILTFTGEAKGEYIKSVSPDAEAVTVRQHHSFIQLPDDNYQPREFHASSGFFELSFFDYASPIHEPLEKKYITRHRLEKKNPAAKMSEAKEPIIYYLDPGCPEPVKSALLEGASWWNEAFESAGYINAFQVKVLPENVDPLDVRYNVIQWVHRSTRGWSYGASVVDPRTGEIIKGHVSLGSLRVRQDYMIAQGILSPFENDGWPASMQEMALARLRQLSAHEIGHTIGMAHNFAASFNDRASVMDYPHPYIQYQKDKFDLTNAYDDKIGSWDKRTVLYGYQDFPDGTNERDALNDIIRENEKEGYLFISDPDARPADGAHPYAHLWDNGKNAVYELNRLMKLRKAAIDDFGENSIPDGTPYSQLENVFVPVYLMHRYQIEAVSKLLGGYDYNYAVKGNNTLKVHHSIDGNIQEEAFIALMETLKPSALEIPKQVIDLILPPAYGYERNRESFKGNTGLNFDPLSAAESLADHTLSFMLNAERLNRMYNDRNSSPGASGLDSYLASIIEQLWLNPIHSESQEAIKESVMKIFFYKLLSILENETVYAQVKSAVLGQIELVLNPSETALTRFEQYLSLIWARWLNGDLKSVEKEIPTMPPGSPIGCGSHF